MNVGKINYGPQFQGKLRFTSKEDCEVTVDATKIKKIEFSKEADSAVVTIKETYDDYIEYVKLDACSRAEYVRFLQVYNVALAAPCNTIISY